MLRQADLAKKKKAELEAKKGSGAQNLLTKVSDKYVLQKFYREFDKVLEFVYAPQESSTEPTSSQAQQETEEE